MLSFLPKYFTYIAIGLYFILLFICMTGFSNNMLPAIWILFGIIEVFVFFYFSNYITKIWQYVNEQVFIKKLFWGAFVLRFMFVCFSYLFFYAMNGTPFEFEAADSTGYYNESKWITGLLEDGKFDIYLKYIGINYADMGYPLYLAILRFIFGDFLIIPRLIKALLGAFTCVAIYKIGRNNFGESAGRIAGILGMLSPNLIFYCGLHVKETEMVFLVVYFVYYGDKILRSANYNLKDISILCIISASIFLFRTVLAACLIASVLLTVFFVSNRILSLGKRIFIFFTIGLLSILILLNSQGGLIKEYLTDGNKNLNDQMENLSTRTDGGGGGNKFAKYGSKSIFFPLMILGPLPTLVDTDQKNIMMLAGGYFTRNIYAFFVFIAFLTLYKLKLLRNHLLLLSTVLSYLFVLGSSGFALSERFHLPIVPFLLVFAGYGITQLNAKNKKYYLPHIALVMILIIGWNWFKLAGRI